MEVTRKKYTLEVLVQQKITIFEKECLPIEEKLLWALKEHPKNPVAKVHCAWQC